MQPLESESGPAGYRIMSDKAERPADAEYEVRD